MIFKMKADIEIVTGFLGAGKTSFINALINCTIVKNETLLILMCENGNKSIDSDIVKDKRIKVIYYPPEKSLTPEYLKYVLSLNNPIRVIIEHNGTWPLNETLKVLNDNKIKKYCHVTSMFHVADSETFNLYFDNMKPSLLPSIQYSNLILLNNIDGINEDEKNIIIEKITKVNSYAFILSSKKNDDLEFILQYTNLLDKGIVKRARYFIKSILNL